MGSKLALFVVLNVMFCIANGDQQPVGKCNCDCKSQDNDNLKGSTLVENNGTSMSLSKNDSDLSLSKNDSDLSLSHLVKVIPSELTIIRDRIVDDLKFGLALKDTSSFENSTKYDLESTITKNSTKHDLQNKVTENNDTGLLRKPYALNLDNEFSTIKSNINFNNTETIPYFHGNSDFTKVENLTSITFANDFSFSSSENASIPSGNATISSENAKKSSENVTISLESVTISSENASISSENSTISSENVVISSENVTIFSENATISLENQDFPSTSSSNHKNLPELADASVQNRKNLSTPGINSVSEIHSGNFFRNLQNSTEADFGMTINLKEIAKTTTVKNYFISSPFPYLKSSDVISSGDSKIIDKNNSRVQNLTDIIYENTTELVSDFEEFVEYSTTDRSVEYSTTESTLENENSPQDFDTGRKLIFASNDKTSTARSISKVLNKTSVIIQNITEKLDITLPSEELRIITLNNVTQSTIKNETRIQNILSTTENNNINSQNILATTENNNINSTTSKIYFTRDFNYFKKETNATLAETSENGNEKTKSYIDEKNFTRNNESNSDAGKFLYINSSDPNITPINQITIESLKLNETSTENYLANSFKEEEYEYYDCIDEISEGTSNLTVNNTSNIANNGHGDLTVTDTSNNDNSHGIKNQTVDISPEMLSLIVDYVCNTLVDPLPYKIPKLFPTDEQLIEPAFSEQPSSPQIINSHPQMYDPYMYYPVPNIHQYPVPNFHQYPVSNFQYPMRSQERKLLQPSREKSRPK